MLTPKQRAVLDFLHRYKLKHGEPPTLGEVQSHFGLNSRAGVHKHLTALEAAGAIRRMPHVARGIELVESPAAESDCELPLLGAVAAGAPVEAILTREAVRVPRDLYAPDRFALRVRGDSMAGDGILDGDVIVVEPRETARNGETVIALLDESEATVKRFFRERGQVRLQPANPKYKPIYIKPPSRLRVQGVLVGLIRKYNT